MILKIHSEAPIIKGYNRSCVYDLPRQKYDFIPNEITNKLELSINKEEKFINSIIDNEEKEWLNFLLENEYCFFIPKTFINSFPNIDFTWEKPSKLTNAIIEINLDNQFNFKLLESINCKHILIIFKQKQSLNNIIEFLEYNISDLTFKSIDIILPQEMKSNIKNNKEIFKRISSRIKQITSIKFYEEKSIKPYFYPQFTINIGTFSEAINKNLYFNKKIFIDSIGNIKNGFETEKIFGNISTKNDLSDFEFILKKASLSKLWNINKDKITVCKDCEFRYMCIDNRIPKKRNDNSYYYESECAYNPFISKWENDNDFYSLNDCGITNNENDFKIDRSKIKKINESIWNTDLIIE